ncbi:MAG TPA: UvrD-helicase domain-containing protein [Segetibacter sp.]
MNLTSEQLEIINATGNIKINAVAGSGKTTTIIEYARTRPSNSRILYIAFNRTVKLEAKRKFQERGIVNVQVETAHSLAYQHIVYRHRYALRKQEYKSYEIAELLGIEGSGEKHTEYIIANHINKFIAFFCNSDKKKVQEVNYLDVVTEPKARAFVKTYYPYIEKLARLLLQKMDIGEIEITHDFYLKKFQLQEPILSYDYILFDEGQDASAAMLDIFLKQPATKVIVGDTNQQIYGWRYAVNSLEKVDFTTFQLSTSFRFGQSIANLAKSVLQWKNYLTDHKEVVITGMGKPQEKVSKAVIGRTNLGLLLKAIAYVTERKNLKHIYFEGNINSYTYADEGASLYDVLNLYNRRTALIKDKLIKAMKDLNELEEYIEKTEDVQLSMMVDIVKEYGNRIPGIIKSIKDKHVGDDEKDKAEIIFTTVHRCKGMEYDEIQLVNDFVNEEKLEKLKDDEFAKIKLNEEINLLYVAVTRAKSYIHLYEAQVPLNFPPSPEIHVIKTVPKEADNKMAPPKNTYEQLEPLPGYKEKAREFTTTSAKPWKSKDDKELKEMFTGGFSVKQIGKRIKRTDNEVKARIKKLGLKVK